MVNWQSGLLPCVIGNLLYMKLIGFNGFAWIYGQLAEGSICHGYICILLYMKLIGFNGFEWIYGQLAGGPSVMGTHAFCYI